jgi:hypothetical protein
MTQLRLCREFKCLPSQLRHEDAGVISDFLTIMGSEVQG